MQKILNGVKHFRDQVYPFMTAKFSRLADSQSPEVMFVTCCDSRVDPTLITQCEPGDMFVLRTVGNIIPPYGAAGIEAAAIEFAVTGLQVKDIVVCGHSNCAAVRGLFEPQEVMHMPSVVATLRHAEKVIGLVRDHFGHIDNEQMKLNLATAVNVRHQMDNLQQHPAVMHGIESGRLTLHGWIYQFESGDVFEINEDLSEFVSLTE